jgi:mannose-1-phosphate guanylyltransferase
MNESHSENVTNATEMASNELASRALAAQAIHGANELFDVFPREKNSPRSIARKEIFAKAKNAAETILSTLTDGSVVASEDDFITRIMLEGQVDHSAAALVFGTMLTSPEMHYTYDQNGNRIQFQLKQGK